MWVSSPLSMAFAQTFLAPEVRTVASLLTPPTNNVVDVGTILQPRRLHRWGMYTLLRHERYRVLCRVSSEAQTYFNTRVKQLKVESDKRKADEAKGKGKEE